MIRPTHWWLPLRIRTADALFWLLAVVLVVAILAASTWAGPQEAKSSVCRTSTANAIGSGVCYGRAANGDVLVLTARHCVRNFSVTCEFFLGSPYAVAAKGRVVAVSRNRDLAAVRIPASEFRGRFPSSVPIADMPPEIGSRIITMGCPGGANPTAQAGQVIGYLSPYDMTFTPPPVSGRSGSAIFDGDGDEIIGILTNRRWTGGMPVHGLAESTEAIDGFFGTSRTQATEVQSAETEEVFFRIFRRRRGGCDPGGGGGCGPDCPGGGGDPGGGIGDIAPPPEWEGPGLPDDEIDPPIIDPPIIDPPIIVEPICNEAWMREIELRLQRLELEIQALPVLEEKIRAVELIAQQAANQAEINARAIATNTTRIDTLEPAVRENTIEIQRTKISLQRVLSGSMKVRLHLDEAGQVDHVEQLP